MEYKFSEDITCNGETFAKNLGIFEGESVEEATQKAFIIGNPICIKDGIYSIPRNEFHYAIYIKEVI